MIKMLMYAAAFLLVLGQLADASGFRFSPRPNKAHLINWREWGSRVFEEAKEKDRLILLSLSAVWCHWCHVMDETTYSDEGVIDLINSNFVPVRVDADMRPDIDDLYNQGGWPSTVILTPEGEILSGGTYIPPEEMKAMLSELLRIYREQRQRIQELIREAARRAERGVRPVRTPERSDIEEVIRLLKGTYDSRYGGFGPGQKFPHPEAIDFLLSSYLRERDPELKTMITKTLDGMYTGGLYDDVEGGFFRYSTRPDWSEPHYEKMLEVNAGLIKNYAEAYMVFGEASYLKVVRKGIEYLKANLLDSRSGGFYGSQDADEAYYRRKDRRGLRPPYVDRTIYADSNSRTVSALLSAYAAAGDGEYLRIAKRAADFLIANLYDRDRGVYHYHLDGERHLPCMLSDNVLFGLAMLDLYNATGEAGYRTVAEEIGRFLLGNLYDADGGRFRPSRGTTGVTPVVRGLLSEFNAALSNYRAALLLSRLYRLGGEEGLKKVTEGLLRTLAASYEEFMVQASLYGTLLRWTIEGPVEFTIVAGGEKTGEFLSRLNRLYVPEKVVRVLSLPADRELIRESGYPLDEALYICKGKTCLHPVTDPEGVREVVEGVYRLLRGGRA